MAEQYFCKDCVYFKYSVWDRLSGVKQENAKCEKSKYITKKSTNMVSGKLVGGDIERSYCVVERGSSSPQRCGPDAKYWKPKRKKDLFKYLAKENNE